LSPAVIRVHFPLSSSRVPCTGFVRGFIVFTCLYITPLHSAFWRFEKGEVPRIRFSVPSGLKRTRSWAARVVTTFPCFQNSNISMNHDLIDFLLFFNHGASLAVCSVVTIAIQAFFLYKTLHVLLPRMRNTVFSSYKIY
jgi:hypothetical protein